MMRKTLLLLAATVACAFSAQARKTYTLSSPEGRLQTTVAADDALTYAVTFDGRPGAGRLAALADARRRHDVGR